MTGVLLPINMAQAASSASTNKPEKVNYVDQSQDYQSLDNSYGNLLSKKAQKIEFFALLGLITASLLIPELFYKSKNPNHNKHQNHQPLKSNLKDNSGNMKELNLEKVNDQHNNDLGRKQDIAS
ncbi:MAG: hypothetical protein QNJ18_18020 [Xenococcaceae cyanobacterium MO_167.B52]|nr:hypothetical protein [Xenococcaceae cyanobacterium MO_167.B52]